MKLAAIKRRMPNGTQRAIGKAYVATGALTAPLRMDPDFLMIGASRAGTTTLFHALSQHPQVVRPLMHKGVRYFDLNYDRGPRWYRGHFPLDVLHRDGKLFEASGYYLYHPLVPARMAATLPRVKMIAMLRDPVERAYSGWKHESARGFETLPLKEALAAEDERLAAALADLDADSNAQPHSLRHHSHRSRGEYATQLKRYYSHFSPYQVHVVISEEFFAEPDREFARVLDFLGLPAFTPPGGFPKENARPSASLPADIRAELAEHFAPHITELESLLGRELPWRRASDG